jgi:ABC-type glutathione transport system ATPase component
VIVGRNGVGKTRMLGAMTLSVLGGAAAGRASGEFENLAELDGTDMFAGLVAVSFSAFDSLPPVPLSARTQAAVAYSYVGLASWNEDGTLQSQKSPAELASEFVASIGQCRNGAREARWKHAVAMLESDPLFEAAEISSLLTLDEEQPLKDQAAALFASLSSGHKLVLLTITRLVELVEERTLVLLDEPESHLHPPLLAAFIRALSDLLVRRNGVAIVATHSPVVIQEVPSSCVWKLRRSGTELRAERPEIQTFGENVGVLTHDVFGLEVTNSGFHRMLTEAVAKGLTYEQVLTSFNEELGAEARAVVRALVYQHNIELAE